MGSTLTNTQPKDTYKSLLKTSDSTELSGTAKYVSDGNGNDSPLALSTAGVGIGTANPVGLLHLNSSGATNLYIQSGSGNSAVMRYFIGASEAVSTRADAATGDYYIETGLGSPSERMRILANGGITFNGDTAAANALDDYEEGTFTATAIPSTSGTITLSVNSCTYTKIGRQVTIKGQLVVGSVALPVGTLVTIGGLPFTTINSVAGRGAGSATYFPAVGSGSLALNYQLQNAAEWNLVLTASNIAAGDEFYITLTYFV